MMSGYLSYTMTSYDSTIRVQVVMTFFYQSNPKPLSRLNSLHEGKHKVSGFRHKCLIFPSKLGLLNQ